MVPLIVFALVLVLVIFPLWALIRILGLSRDKDSLEWRVGELERELREHRAAPPVAPSAAPEPAASVPLTPVPEVGRGLRTPPHLLSKDHPAAFGDPALHQTDPAVPIVPIAPAPPAVSESLPVPPAPPPLPAPLPIATPRPAYIPPPPKPAIDWEQFMGAKLFAWLGGLAAFLGAAFFLKYSFEHGWIPPELRVAIGYVFSIGLVITGLWLARTRYAITSQTLCATGVVSLYAVTFACNSIYHFAFFGPAATFGLMTLVTATAFVLAVRLEAQVVAVLGMLGGFLTPVLLSTGHDNPPGLFGYIALLDVGLIAVALHRRWSFLVSLGAGGTVIMQIGWASKFLNAEKSPTAMVVCLMFCALFLGACFASRWRGQMARAMTESDSSIPPHFIWSAVGFPFVALGFAVAFLDYGTIAARPGLLFSFVLAADLCLLALTWFEETLPKLHLVGGLVVFGLLAAWTSRRLTPELLPWALAFYLVYAVLHTAFPLLFERHRPGAGSAWWSQVFPPLTLGLMLFPLFKLTDISLLFWPCVLVLDLLAIALALVTASLISVGVVLVLTLIVTAAWMLHVPATVASEPSLLMVIGGFAVFFFVAGMFLTRRLGDRIGAGGRELKGLFGDARSQIPAFSALLPFLLLVMMTQRLPMANPSSIFGLALLLTVLTLGLACLLAIEWLPACALVGVAALEYAWQTRHFSVDHANVVVGWEMLFLAVFAAYPFVFWRRFAAQTGPWAIAALAGVLQFPLVYRVVTQTWPNEFMGVLPALFTLPPLASLFALLRGKSVDASARLNQLAWFGGVALLFITLIFPIQFERQWITVAWALEGLALLWLFPRVPHPGLRATGVVLLVVAFARLALNPAVLEYHARSGTPIRNWYLYSYGIVAACLFAAVGWLRPQSPSGEKTSVRIAGINTPALLATLGIVLAFLLVNIEIADFFRAPGTRVLAFEFSGNFARDMTYTIAWALYALGLLLASFWKSLPAGRIAALSLLGVALLKLFLHDLARLEALYRIGALFGVAVIAIVASLVYQRFLPSTERSSLEQN